MSMPANRNLKSNLKSFVGRIFSLRKVNLIPTYKDSKGTHNGYQIPQEDIGEAVMVLDETNTKVCIVRSSGGTIWIPKYYLLKEIKSEMFRKCDSITETIGRLGTIAKSLREQDNELATEIEQAILELRTLADNERDNVVGKSNEKI